MKFYYHLLKLCEHKVLCLVLLGRDCKNILVLGTGKCEEVSNLRPKHAKEYCADDGIIQFFNSSLNKNLQSQN